MTTSVKVHAYCGANKEVRVITLNGDGAELTCIVLQNNETSEVFVYDDNRIVVREVNKGEV